ncbi:MAG: cytochrome ubiquinol oxidase subunit I [Waddliaceae bacterium]
MTVEVLSRIQFAFSITFHYIYPPLSIGLSLAIIYMEWMFLRTRSKAWEATTKFWIRVFALTFALGVATGIPLPISFGTNWARYSEFVGDIFGSALAAEGVFAFLVEAGFLGILIFGWDRVSHWVHFIATIMVSLAAHFSAVWIVVANSWMQTPAGYETFTRPDGTTGVVVTDWWTMILNKTSVDHVLHVIIACWMAGAFLIISIAAYYLLKKRFRQFAITSMKIGLVIATVSSVLQLVSADQLATKIAEFNPEKFASFEGVFKTQEFTPMYLLGYVDEENQTTRGISIPGLLSFLVHRDFKTPVAGLEEFSKDRWPKVNAVFQFYHIMITMWGLMVVASILGIYLWRTGKWNQHPWILKFLIASVIFPQLGGLAGWYAAEMGRQPWVVYNLLKTVDAYSESIILYENIISLAMFVFLYLSFFIMFLWILDQKIKHGPDISDEHIPWTDKMHREREKRV